MAPERLSRFRVVFLLFELLPCYNVPELRIVLVMGVFHQRSVSQDRHPRVIVYSAAPRCPPVLLAVQLCVELRLSARSAALDGDVRAVEVPEHDCVQSARRFCLQSTIRGACTRSTMEVEGECKSKVQNAKRTPTRLLLM